MKRSKIVILAFTLSFPVLIYLFLRSYGQNQFDLPVFFDNDEKIYCKNSQPFNLELEMVNSNEMESVDLSDVHAADYSIIHFPNVKDLEIQTLKNELNRVLNTFDEQWSINVSSFVPTDTANLKQTKVERFLNSKRANSITYLQDQKGVFINCVYAFPTQEWDGEHPSEETIDIDKTLVLLDEKDRIRGYYNGYETKEVDRLILEIRVLLSKK